MFDKEITEFLLKIIGDNEKGEGMYTEKNNKIANEAIKLLNNLLSNSSDNYV
jgi:hypothetical protein